MHLAQFIRQESAVVGNRIVFMLMFSGLAAGALVSVVNHTASAALNGTLDGRMLFLYLAIFTLYIYTQKYSLANSIYPLNEALYKLRLRLVEKSMACDLRKLEGISDSEIQYQLVGEFNLAVQLAPWISYSAQSAMILMFCLVYLAWLSAAVFLVMLVTLVATVLWHLFVEEQIHREFRAVCGKEMEFSRLVETLARRAGEIRLHQTWRDTLWSSLTAVSKQSQEHLRIVDKQTIASITSSRMGLFLLLAVFVFIIPVNDPHDKDLLFKITVITFFIMGGPVTQLVYALPLLLRLDYALASLYNFEARLDVAGRDDGKGKAFEPDFHSLRLATASFTYASNKIANPLFADLNLTIRQGAVIFIHGLPGSGKTTLLKLLCGLYLWDSGSIHVGKQKVKETEYPAYRDLFACTFDGLPPLALHTQPLPEISKVQELLAKTGLEEAVEYDATGALHYTALSTLMQWRLTVVATLLQDRPIYLFDDGASRENEKFTRYFYEECLADLRRAGKTVVVVARDSRFLHLADVVWEIGDGTVRIVDQEQQSLRIE